MDLSAILSVLYTSVGQMSAMLSQMSPEETEETKEKKEVVRLLQEHFKRILSNRELTLQDVLQKIFWLFYLNKRNFTRSSHIWNKNMSYWDFNFRHICAIFQHLRNLPPGTVILSPIAGNCFLEALLERLGVPVLANDINDSGFTFMQAPVSHMDGLAFVSKFVAENPGVPFSLLMSWAPVVGHKSPEIGTLLMEFAARTPLCQCVFHISEGKGGCTDVDATFDVIDRYFREVWQIGRYPSLFDTISKLQPIHDALFCLVPIRRK
jgi:hypothetical protein